MLLRTLVAVLAVVIFWALLPPVSRILGFPVDGDLFLIIKIIVAALAVFYILRGPVLSWPQKPTP